MRKCKDCNNPLTDKRICTIYGEFCTNECYNKYKQLVIKSSAKMQSIVGGIGTIVDIDPKELRAIQSYVFMLENENMALKQINNIKAI